MSCNKWQNVKLGDLIESISVTHSFNKNKLIFLNTSDILEGKVLHNNYSEIEGLPGQAKKSIQKDDILLSEIRPKNKRFAYVDFDSDDYVVSTKLMVLRRKSNNINNRYLYYYLTSNKTLNYLQTIAEGRSGTFPQITFNELKMIEIDLPPLEEQEKIANILSSLYDKIELNNEMNKTLEEMAQSIFKRWFIDFEFPNEDGQPYKSSGGEMVDSEFGMIPKGWKIKELGETDIVIEDGDRGKNYPKKSEFLKYGYCPFLNNKNIIDDKISLVDSDFITEERHKLLRKGTININDIILTTRGSVGNIGIFNKYLGYEFARINSGMVIIKNKEEFNLMYLYQLLKMPSMKEQYKSMSTGTAQPQLPIKDIKKFKILKPNKSIQDKIGYLLSSIYDLVFSNDQESLNISIKRDLLLPKLMSGEINLSK